MSVFTFCELYCDHPDCEEWFDYRERTPAKVRRMARFQGWERVGDTDYCPKHARQGGAHDAP